MQRLEESKDFRPFKFRIQAFTNSFIEKLTSRDFTTEEVSGKLVSPVIALYSLSRAKPKSRYDPICGLNRLYLASMKKAKRPSPKATTCGLWMLGVG